MRLVILKFAYPRYLRQFYARDPALRARSYAEQKAAYDHDAFWWGDGWARALRPLGYEVDEIVMNNEPLQQAWARENRVEATGITLLSSVLEEQLRRLRPDVLFIQSFAGLSPLALDNLRESCPSLRAVVGWSGSRGAATGPELGRCDAVVSCIPELVAELSADGHRCFHLNHAFDPAVMDRLGEPASEDIDLTFLGHLAAAEQHTERLRVLRAVGRESGLQVYSDLPRWPVPIQLARTLAAKTTYATAQGLLRLGVPRSALHGLPGIRHATAWRYPPRYVRAPVGRGSLHPSVYGLRMLRMLQRSRVTLNVHSSVSLRSASNIRLFEATGAGTCLLTDARGNLGDLFELDREVVAYGSAAEALEKARWLLDHPAERGEIAAAAQRRVASEHTFAHRAPRLDEIFREVLA